MIRAPERIGKHGAAWMVLVLLFGACTPRAAPPRPASPAPEPVDSADVAAVAAILRLEDRREFSLDALQRFAASRSSIVRVQTALALARLRRPEGLPLVTKLLADPDTAVAATAAFAVGQIGDSTAASLLARELSPAQVAARPDVASEAAYALGKLGSREAGDSLASLLARAPVEDSAYTPAVGSALLAIWKFPRPAQVDHISRWAASGNAELRWRAAYALTRRHDPRAVPFLLDLASDADARVRSISLSGLTRPLVDSAGADVATTLQVLRAALEDSAYAPRISAARSLGSYTRPEAVSALIQTLAAPRPHLVLAAMAALRAIGSPARAAVERLRARAFNGAAPVALRAGALDALAAIDPGAGADAAEILLDDSHWRMRAAAANAVAAAAGPTDVRLARLVDDPDPRVSGAALRAAVEAAGDTLAPLRSLLLQELGARDVFVRAVAIEALADLGEPAVLPALLDAYDRAQRDTVADAALAAVNAIAALRRPGLDPARTFFLRFPRSDDYLVRLAVRHAFGEQADSIWGDPFPVESSLTPADYTRLARQVIESSTGRIGDPEVVIETDSARIQLRLFAAAAPLTTDNFLRLVDRGYFDGQEWPRVVPNFVVQGGDPRGDTNGGPGYTIRDEINRHRYGSGALGMALSGPDTGGSQFFITHSPQPHLDGTYALFGEVVVGRALTETILPGDRITRVERIR